MSGHTVSPLFDWRRAITASGLEPTTRHVALTVSLHMNGIGSSCFPSQTTLAAETGLARTTVNEHLRKLRAAGFLRVAHRRRLTDGRQSSNEYQAVIPAHLVEVRREANEEGVESIWLESPGGARVPQDDTDLSVSGTLICPSGGHHEGAIEDDIEGATTPSPPQAEGTTETDAAHPDDVSPAAPSPLSLLDELAPGDRGAVTASERKRRSRVELVGIDRAAFESWWSRYPRSGGSKGNRQAAERAWRKALKAGATVAELDLQLGHYEAAREAYRTVWDVLPSLLNASTFLNGRRVDWAEPWDRDDLMFWPAPRGWSWEDRPVTSRGNAGDSDDCPPEVKAQGLRAMARWYDARNTARAKVAGAANSG